LSGFVTESTPDGPVPVVGHRVSCSLPAHTGLTTVTDQNGFYEIRGLITGSNSVSLGLRGYRGIFQIVTITSNTRLDFTLVRQ
jgi:hypothetical protein